MERAVARVMIHCGWRDVSIIGRSGDMGADIVGSRLENDGNRIWVVQVKAVEGWRLCRNKGLEEVMQAQSIYGAHVAVLATNGDFLPSAFTRRDELKETGFDVRLWNGKFLVDLLGKWPEINPAKKSLRKYQERITNDAVKYFEAGEEKYSM